MYSLKFPYKERRNRFLPIVPIILFGREDYVYAEAYVDSGAFYSIFDIEIMNNLSIELSQSKTKMFIVGNGSFIHGHVVKIPVQMGVCKFISEIAFSDELNVGFNLIGRKGIFEHFDEVIFREKKREIEFKKY